MPSVFDRLIDFIERLGPAGIVVQAIVATAVAIGLLLAFILGRRTWKSRVFRRRDRRSLVIRRKWNEIVGGAVPPEEWRFDPVDREIVETILLDKLEMAQQEEATQLLRCLRESGLLDMRIYEARQYTGWRRRQALVSLGRMRAPEVIPALSHALEDRHHETRIAAVRGLGRLGLPEAAIPILDRVVLGELDIPPTPLQNALLNCCRWRPSILVPYVRKAKDETRGLLARVLGEIATGDLDEDLLLLAYDPLPDVRAAAARALGEARLGVALSALGTLAADTEWFVRLRAVVSLGQLQHPRTIPVLVELLCDKNRYVRLRSAMALARLEEQLPEIFALVTQKHDRYALQALVSELQRSGAILDLVSALRVPTKRAAAEAVLMAVLRSGAQRLLLATLSHHADWHVRVALARLLARSGEPQLVPQLQKASAEEKSPRQKRITRWLLHQLGNNSAEEVTFSQVPA
ncbi:MAG: HEAT repeat domain-containing protein [Acidobacteria bacterium]|nr:HEAT repeat domain-containing protein [Acidobacteriota bacterium]